MLDPVIGAFFTERKEGWLKKFETLDAERRSAGTRV